jgi:putative ABC transport system permease protein
MNSKKNDLLTMIWQMTLMSLRYLNGRRLRTVLTTLAIVFGVALIFSFNTVLPSVTSIFKQSMTTMTGADITITSATGEAFSPDVLSQVEALANVEAVTGIYRRTFTLPSIGADDMLGEATQIELIGIDLDTIQSVRQFTISEGRFLEAGDSGKVLIPAGLADFAPELRLGTTFPLITAGGIKFYTLVGLVAEEGNFSTPEIYMTLSDAQAAFNQEGLINSIEVSIAASADQAIVSQAILDTLGTSFVLNHGNDATTAFASLQVGLTIFNLFGMLALFLGAFLIFNTFRTVVLERRHDIGMLRAIGASRRQIMTMILIESLIQGVIGTALGLILGYFLAIAIMAAMSKVVVDYLHVGNISLQFKGTALLLAIGLGLLTSLVAGYLPARTASHTSPLEALRPSSTASVNKAARWSLLLGLGLMIVAMLLIISGTQGSVSGALLFMIGMVIAAPALVIPVANLFSPILSIWFAREGDLARGNLIRQPGRAAITGSTLMIGLAVLVMMAAMVSGFDGLIKDLANTSFSSDIILMPQTLGVYNNVIGADESLANRLREIPEVETVSSLRYASSAIDGKALQVLGIDPNTYQEVASLEFNQGTPESAFPALNEGRNAIVSSLTMNTLKLTMDSDFVIETADGPQTYHIVGVANDMLTFKIASIFISQANLAADFHKEEDVFLLLNLLPNTDANAALTEVQTITNDYPQFTPHLTGEYRDEIVNLSVGYLGMFYILALLIIIPAALGLLNTLSINIIERTREIGVVRAIGGSQSQVQRIVAGEALLLGIFSAAMGVLTGVVISYGFVMAFGLIGWQMPYVFPLMGVIAALIIAVILALFASILPARNAAKLDIIKALQYQ